MATMTIQVSGLGRQEIAKLRAQAKTLGLSAEGYAKQLIQDGILLEHVARTKTFDELYAPAQAAFRESGMTEEELGHLVDQARGRYRRRSSKRKG
jgi:hypothetical protein